MLRPLVSFTLSSCDDRPPRKSLFLYGHLKSVHCRAAPRDASGLIPTPCDEIVYKGFSGSNNFVCWVVPLVQWNTLNHSINEDGNQKCIYLYTKSIPPKSLNWIWRNFISRWRSFSSAKLIFCILVSSTSSFTLVID